MCTDYLANATINILFTVYFTFQLTLVDHFYCLEYGLFSIAFMKM